MKCVSFRLSLNDDWQSNDQPPPSVVKWLSLLSRKSRAPLSHPAWSLLQSIRNSNYNSHLIQPRKALYNTHLKRFSAIVNWFRACLLKRLIGYFFFKKSNGIFLTIISGTKGRCLTFLRPIYTKNVPGKPQSYWSHNLPCLPLLGLGHGWPFTNPRPVSQLVTAKQRGK